MDPSLLAPLLTALAAVAAPVLVFVGSYRKNGAEAASLLADSALAWVQESRNEITALKSAVRQLEGRLDQVSRENTSLRLWCFALRQQVVDAGLEPVSYESIDEAELTRW